MAINQCFIYFGRKLVAKATKKAPFAEPENANGAQLFLKYGVKVLIKFEMAHSRKNYLLRIVDIQELTLEHTKKGTTQEWVYKNIIEPRYRISKSTYYNYLAVPAKKELKILEQTAVQRH